MEIPENIKVEFGTPLIIYERSNFELLSPIFLQESITTNFEVFFDRLTNDQNSSHYEPKHKNIGPELTGVIKMLSIKLADIPSRIHCSESCKPPQIYLTSLSEEINESAQIKHVAKSQLSVDHAVTSNKCCLSYNKSSDNESNDESNIGVVSQFCGKSIDQKPRNMNASKLGVEGNKLNSLGKFSSRMDVIKKTIVRQFKKFHAMHFRTYFNYYEHKRK